MNVEQFDFHLPKERIAQHPSEKRDHSKLMVVSRQQQTMMHHQFYEILNYLTNQDVLVINNTKVIPARLIGKKVKTDAVIEVLLLKRLDTDVWQAMTKPARRIQKGDQIQFGNQLMLTCIETADEGLRTFQLTYEGLLIERLQELGTMPLPPYITEKLKDQNRYQTVYAAHEGSAAAPTAGLHFTPELLKAIEEKGVLIVPITLNVGLGTFKPVSVTDVTTHQMHAETYTMSLESAHALNQAVSNKKRIVCVGTTSIRTLESNYHSKFHPGTFETSIFIYPGYQFRVVDALITNFHLPKSTLMMLVSAFSSTELMQSAYQLAIEERYRFFSFGDAMFIY